MMFSHLCNDTPAPPISFTSASQRSWILSRSGGPHGISPLPGKMRYVTFRSLTGRFIGFAEPLISFAMRNDASPALSAGPTSPTSAGNILSP